MEVKEKKIDKAYIGYKLIGVKTRIAKAEAFRAKTLANGTTPNGALNKFINEYIADKNI